MQYNQGIEKQVKEYNSLDWKNSYRKQSALILRISACVVILASFLGGNPMSIVVAIVQQLITFIPLSFFITMGKRWSLVVTLFLWTYAFITEVASYMANIQKTRNITYGEFKIILAAAALYFFTMRIFIKALRVENEIRHGQEDKKNSFQDSSK